MNALQQIPVPYGSMLHIPPTNLLLLAAKPEPYKKAYLFTNNIEEFSGKSLEQSTSRQKKIQDTYRFNKVMNLHCHLYLENKI